MTYGLWEHRPENSRVFSEIKCIATESVITNTCIVRCNYNPAKNKSMVQLYRVPFLYHYVLDC